jgi:hypothetical protein
VRQRLVNIVAARPDGIAIGDLVNAVYADDPDGGPVTAPRSVNVMIHRANAQLAVQGYQIKSMWLGRGARYHLVSAANIQPIQSNSRANGNRRPDVFRHKQSNSVNSSKGKGV